MNKNDHYKGKEKKQQRKYTYNNQMPKRAYIPLYPNQMQPVLVPTPMTPMMNQPQPIYQMAPVAPVYPMMQPVPQQMPQRYTMAVPIGPPKTMMVPIGQPIPVATPINQQPVIQKQQKPKIKAKTPKKQKPAKKIIIVREHVRDDDDDDICSIF